MKRNGFDLENCLYNFHLEGAAIARIAQAVTEILDFLSKKKRREKKCRAPPRWIVENLQNRHLGAWRGRIRVL